MIIINNLKHHFTSGGALILEHLQINLGDFVVILGPNGCGKSTLIKLISSTYALQQGSIQTQGAAAVVSQNTALEIVGSLSVLENIALTLSKGHFFSSYKRFVPQAIQLLSPLGLESKLYEPVDSLSGGQRQLISTTLALEKKSPILLLDEPSAALDPKSKQIFLSLMRQSMKASKRAAMMVTHDIHEALHLGNRLILMQKNANPIVFDAKEKAQLSTQQLQHLLVTPFSPEINKEPSCPSL